MACQKDLIYFYDGSFEGFLCCVFESYANREIPFDIWQWATRQMSMFPSVAIRTDIARAERVHRSVKEKLGPRVYRLLTMGFLNGDEGKEIKLLRFLRLCYSEGGQAAGMIGRSEVADVLDLQKAVENEAHLLKGFLRFEEREGMLGSIIRPRHYVLPLLASHFRQRFPEENFVIFDENHRLALLYSDRQAKYLEFEQVCLTRTPEEHEAAYQRMWKSFYKALTIEERRNEKLMQSNCPRRFWQNMTEMQEQL